MGEIVENLQKLKDKLDYFKKKGKKIVFTNGVFDIVHVGHLSLLKKCKSFGDILVVAINTDNSVKKIKGPDRPIIPETERAQLIAGFEPVDYVILFDELTPEKVIDFLKPNVHVKGGDYREEDLPEAKVIKKYGGEIKIVELQPGYSTTNIVDKILYKYGKFEDEKILSLKKISDEIRKLCLKAIYYANSGHPGPSLSCIDILVTLYFSEMRYNPKFSNWNQRDRFILSKGHAAPALYAVLAKAGFIKESEVLNLRKLRSPLQGHPISYKVPGIEISTGSLGQGISVAEGLAIGGKISKSKYNVYCLVGDGELQEGQVWESFLRIGNKKLDNLCIIIDRNYMQSEGSTEEIIPLEPLNLKLRSFNFNVIEIEGHNFRELLSAFSEFKKEKNKTTVIIAHTVKGKGVYFMENQKEYHAKAISKEELYFLQETD